MKSTEQIEQEQIKEFVKELNQAPSKESIVKSESEENWEYIPISFIEKHLDDVFNGLWSTTNYRTSMVDGMITGDIDLEVYNRAAKAWITRTGSASIKVKILESDYPHLKAECIKNACKSLGESFGRNLNREFVDSYNPVEETSEKTVPLKKDDFIGNKKPAKEAAPEQKKEEPKEEMKIKMGEVAGDEKKPAKEEPKSEQSEQKLSRKQKKKKKAQEVAAQAEQPKAEEEVDKVPAEVVAENEAEQPKVEEKQPEPAKEEPKAEQPEPDVEAESEAQSPEKVQKDLVAKAQEEAGGKQEQSKAEEQQPEPKKEADETKNDQQEEPQTDDFEGAHDKEGIKAEFYGIDSLDYQAVKKLMPFLTDEAIALASIELEYTYKSLYGLLELTEGHDESWKVIELAIDLINADIQDEMIETEQLEDTPAAE